jgi:integrase
MDEAATPASEGIQGLLKAADVRDRALLALFALEGLSVRQVEDLRRGDVHLNESPQIHVRRGGRGNAPRNLPLHPLVARYLDEHLKEMPWKEADDPLFLGGEGGPLTVRQMQRVCRSLCERAGLGKITPHQLRHTWTRAMLHQGMELGKMARHLGLRTASFVQSAYPSFARAPSRPRRRPGRPRRQEERDALLVELKKGLSYRDVAKEYARQHPDEPPLGRDAVIKAIKRWEQEHPTEEQTTNGE